ncbi:uncharacterized protein LOC107840455 [Capsicum annuum]|uniref:uncharacterized protein LOC107840455 n=1 Tax=Capsicum annuum TaxID=4072 RepID=UPI001FB0DB7F|nr:uncharacterized protein LOC107840455 [Capsicum annuum]
MKEIRKAAAEKSKKAVGKSSRLSKKDDSGHPRLPKLYSMGGMPHVLNVWMYECCSEVDSTIAKRVGNVIPQIFNWQVVGIKVRYEKFMVGMFGKIVPIKDLLSTYSHKWTSIYKVLRNLVRSFL